MKSSNTTETESGKVKSAKTAKPKAKPTNLLSLCPSQGAGWCSFPFSPSQLKKRLKTKISKAKKAADEK